MTTAEARKVFDDQIADRTNADEIANLELLREYFTNTEFREWMHREVARINGAS